MFKRYAILPLVLASAISHVGAALAADLTWTQINGKMEFYADLSENCKCYYASGGRQDLYWDDCQALIDDLDVAVNLNEQAQRLEKVGDTTGAAVFKGYSYSYLRNTAYVMSRIYNETEKQIKCRNCVPTNVEAKQGD